MNIDAHSVLRLQVAKNNDTKNAELIYVGKNTHRTFTLPPGSGSLILLPEERLALFRLMLEVQDKGEKGLKWTVRAIADLCDANLKTVSYLIRKLVRIDFIVADILRLEIGGERTAYLLSPDSVNLLQKSAFLEGIQLEPYSGKCYCLKMGITRTTRIEEGFPGQIDGSCRFCWNSLILRVL